MSTVLKTEAIVLRVHRWSRTSHIVEWLTPERGVLKTVIKGARRPKSLFLGQYDLYYTCELLYYARERGGLHIAKECTPLRYRRWLRQDWRAAGGASYMAHTILRCASPGTNAHEVFEVFTAALDGLRDPAGHMALLTWFDLRFPGTIGAPPNLSSCSRCSRGLAPAEPVRFAPAAGGVVCNRCPPSHDPEQPDNAVRPMPPDLRALLRRWQSLPVPDTLSRYPVTAAQQLTIVSLTGSFLAHHLDTSGEPRRIAYACAAAQDAARLVGFDWKKAGTRMPPAGNGIP